MVCICALHVMCTLPPRLLTQNSRWVFLVLEIVFCTLRLENGLGGFSWASGLVGLRISSYLVFLLFIFIGFIFSYCLPAGAGGCCWAAAGLLLGIAGGCWWLVLVAAGGLLVGAAGLLLGCCWGLLGAAGGWCWWLLGGCWWVLLGCCWAAAGDCWGLLVVAAGGCLLLLGYIYIYKDIYIDIYM